MRQTTVFILAPGNSYVSGGPELCHQLADVLNRHSKRAFIVYISLDKAFRPVPIRASDQQHEIPERYRRYNIHTANLEDIEPGSVVVLPELYGSIIKEEWFPGCQIYFWWMSANMVATEAETGSVIKWIGWWRNDAIEPVVVRNKRAFDDQLDNLRCHVTTHLYQSDYARKLLDFASLEPASRLSDYLSDDYIRAMDSAPSWPRQNLLVYNPKKGLPRTKLILQAMEGKERPMPDVVPIRDMSESQVRELLGRAKLYIDFGEHPGKDRIPREAAAMGACVLVNRRGSAANPIDMPIPQEFKIDDRQPGFESLAADKVYELMDDFEVQQPRFDTYRDVIAQEHAKFVADVHAIFDHS